jgi:hypothetical protein
MITTIMQQSTKVKLNCIALLWSWWKTRNRLNTEGGNWRQDQVVIQVQRLAAEYEFFVKDKKDLVQGTPRWKPPEGDVLKINFDGAFDPVSHSGGWGFVVRNSLGEVVGAAAGRLDHVNEALQAEAEACSRALSIVQKWGISHIVLESDSQILVRAINMDEDDRGPNGVLFKEIKESLFLNFICFSFTFCLRACNKVVDVIAAYGARLCDESVAIWPDHAPAFTHVVVASDLAEHVE